MTGQALLTVIRLSTYWYGLANFKYLFYLLQKIETRFWNTYVTNQVVFLNRGFTIFGFTLSEASGLGKIAHHMAGQFFSCKMNPTFT